MKKKHKIILAGLATLLVLAGIAWKLAAPRVLAGVQDLLLKQVNSFSGLIGETHTEFCIRRKNQIKPA